MSHTLDRTNQTSAHAETDRRERLGAAWHAAWNHGEVAALDGLLSPSYVRRRGPAGTPQDRGTFKESIAAVREAFPDLHTEIVDLVEDGDRMAVRWRSTGHHTGAFLGVPPTGRPVEVSGATFARFDGDAIAEEWVTFDSRQLLEALGIITTGHTAAVDPDLVRGVHRKFITGVTVVTTDDGGTPRGLAVNAFSSISLDPPMVLVCVQRSSSTHPALHRSRHLGISILAADQLDVAKVFASKGDDKFATLDWAPGEHGAPLIDGAAAQLEVEIGERLEAGSHTVFTGRVVSARHDDRAPLVYSGGGFFDISQTAPLPW
ncbi:MULTISPECIES: flavin reductase [Streptomyces]|uniref:flavin reductase n=1 Tax=Streptomyces TaxID=1883 RepID=UPI001CCCB898|nr:MULTISPECIES: flavin reductase [Streptomyces]MBZ6247305.1 flavin reductase [Streptomyces olivaceus]MCU8589389.1 flavin reductase [Streptomyces sp. A13(2022)]